MSTQKTYRSFDKTIHNWYSFDPRPQFSRDASCRRIESTDWTLNGRALDGAPWEHKTSEEHLVYEHRMELDDTFCSRNSRTILHFGAVDQVCSIFVNDIEAGSHEGGYLPFSLDITGIVHPGINNLRVEVTDTLSFTYPYGKQCKKPHGMWYTPVSGIWQPVWMETVPAKEAVRNIRITPDLKGIWLEIDTDAESTAIIIEEKDGTRIRYIRTRDRRIRIDLPDPHLWTPKDPYLYYLKLQTATDHISSYFALRTVTIEKIDAHDRFCLNGKPVFLHGVLDQGYFNDGIYLPHSCTDYAVQNEKLQELGFNTIRKHIKIEPDVFYYYCDRQGILVIQDMVNSGKYRYFRDSVFPTVMSEIGVSTKDIGKKPAEGSEEEYRRKFFEQSVQETIDLLYNHPCVIGYTVFNEGWGQFDSDRIYEAAKAQDPSRIYDSTSGWFAQQKSDVQSEHVYFRNKRLKSTDSQQPRFLFLTECGGYACSIPGHNAMVPAEQKSKIYGYGKTCTQEELVVKIEKMYNEMVIPSIGDGLCGCIYTQIADVENEINGLFTSDKQICKVDKTRMQAIAGKLYAALSGLPGQKDSSNKEVL